MKRLTDLPADNPLTSRAQALLRAMGPTVESEERMQRVRRALDAPASSAAPRWTWRVGLASGVLGISAAAAAGSTGVSRLLGLHQTTEDGAPRVPSSRPAKPPSPIAAPGPLPAERVVEAAPSSKPARSATPMSAPTLRAVTPPLSDVARVHEAAKALRHDGDAERALQLLERGAPVTGPLAEEALALRIEASMARGNGRQVKLATAYLAQYPQGRYRELAKKALSGSVP